MAGRYEISAIFKMIDNFSAPLKKITVESSSFMNAFKNDMARMDAGLQAGGKALKKMAGLGIAAGTALAGKTVVDSIKTYAEFEDTVTKAASTFSDLVPGTESYTEAMDKLQASAREVGAVTQFSANDAAGALWKMGQAGISSEKAMSMLMGTTNLAMAAGTDLTQAVDIATDALGIYGKSLNLRGFNTVESQLDKISDVMAKTSIMANTDLAGLFEAMTYSGNSFDTAGQTIETLSAAIGTLSSAGTKGSSAGTALSAIFNQLSNAKKIAEMKDLGIDVMDAAGNFRNLFDIVGDLENSLAGMGNVQQSSILNSIFGVRGSKAIADLLKVGSAGLKEYEAALMNSAGTAKIVADAQSNSFVAMMKQIQSAWQEKQIQIGDAFKVGGAKDALAGFITYLQNLDITPITNFLTRVMQAIPGIVAGAGDILGTIKNVFSTLLGLKAELITLVAVWGTYKASVLVALAVEKVISFFTAIKAVQAATEGMTAAQAALNVVMNANPIGIVIGVISALALIIVEVVKHWDSISAALTRFGECVANVASLIWDKLILAFNAIKEFFIEFQPLLTLFMGPLGLMVNMVVELFKNLENIKSAFSDGGFIAGIKTIGNTIIASILAPIQKVLELMSHIPFIGDKVGLELDRITNLRNSLLLPVSNESALSTTPVAPVRGDELHTSLMEELIRERQQIDITVAAEKGTRANVNSRSPECTLNVIRSGSF